MKTISSVQICHCFGRILFGLTIVFGLAEIKQAQQPASTKAKMYLAMSEDEQKQFIAKKAEEVSFQFGNGDWTGITEKITPQVVLVLKPFVDAYASRANTPRSEKTCHFGRDNLSAVLLRWWQNHDSIDTAFKTPLTENSDELERLQIDPGKLEKFRWRVGSYLAMVESEFCLCLQNPSGAAGMFQLSRERALTYGLQITAKNPNPKNDERCTLKQSATTATKILKAMASKEFVDYPSQMLAALVYFHSGENTPVNAEDKFWTFVTRKEMRTLPGTDTANGQTTIVKERIETEAFNYVRKLIAAGIILENAELFVDDLPPEASRAARMKKLHDKVDDEVKEGMVTIMLTFGFLKFLEQPTEDISEDLTKSLTPSEIKKYFPNFGDNYEQKLSERANSELQPAPRWLKKFIVNLHTFNPLKSNSVFRIIQYRYRDQTVFNLTEYKPKGENADKSKMISLIDKDGKLYDANGNLLCHNPAVMNESDNIIQNCPDFISSRKDGKLIWQDTEKKFRTNRSARPDRR